MLQRLITALAGKSDPHATTSRGKRLLVLAAAVGVPAFAAPADWSGIEASEEATQALAAEIETMPFETPGMGFPGSAFYYLEQQPELALALPAIDPKDAPEDKSKLGKRIDAGPSALPFAAAGSGLDKARALRCLTQAIYYEAASESNAGQRAVAQVVLNRVAHRAWPGNVCGVVFEGSQRRTGCQFSFTCDGSMARQPSRKGWSRAQGVAARALAGDVYDPIGLATHYHTNWVNPYWAKTLDHIGTIGAHRFYRWKGKNGQPVSFNFAYRGGETTASFRTSVPAEDPVRNSVSSVTPAAVSTPGEVTPVAVPEQSTIAAPYAGAGQVKQEYAGVGQWLSDPAKPQD